MSVSKNGIDQVKAMLGELNTAEAAGGVTATDLVMAYIKQVVTDSETLLEHEVHLAAILPESTANLVVLTAHATANTWSAWAEVADNQGSPDTLSSKFASNSGHITAMVVEDTDQIDTLFMVEVSYGDSKTIVSRHRILTEDKKIATAQVEKGRGGIITAGETIYYRSMCATAGGKTLNVHFRYFLH